MTKQELIELIEKYVPDGEQVAWQGFWVRSDVEEWCEQDLTDEQWDKVVYWFSRYTDSSEDLNEAVFYATKEQD